MAVQVHLFAMAAPSVPLAEVDAAAWDEKGFARSRGRGTNAVPVPTGSSAAEPASLNFSAYTERSTQLVGEEFRDESSGFGMKFEIRISKSETIPKSEIKIQKEETTGRSGIATVMAKK
jgi:hypothetical protein